MEAKQKALVLCALTVEAKRIDDPRYQFDTEEKDGVVVRCIINNAEVLMSPVSYIICTRTKPRRTDWIPWRSL